MIILNPNHKTENSLQNATLLVELTAEESSNIVGGFTVTNDSGGTRSFYNLGANVVPQRQILQPGQQGNYSGEYILYNTSTNGFQPALANVGPFGTASFRQEGNGITVAANPPSFHLYHKKT